MLKEISLQTIYQEFDGNLPKGPYPPCLRMADRALLAGYPRIIIQPKYDKAKENVFIWLAILFPGIWFKNISVLNAVSANPGCFE